MTFIGFFGMSDNMFLVFGIVLFIVGIVLFVVGFVWFRQKRLIENTPTSKIRSLALGLVEIFGDVVATGTMILKSPHNLKDCVYYRYLVERYEQHYDPKTKSTHGSWVTVKDVTERIQFYLKDDTGSVRVEPNGARITISTDFQITSGDMRFHEWYIQPNDKLYILGTAGLNPSVSESSESHVENLLIQKGKNEKFYFISDKSEKEILKGLSLKTWACLGIGAAFILIGILIITL
jgi:hypothetical protein